MHTSASSCLSPVCLVNAVFSDSSLLGLFNLSSEAGHRLLSLLKLLAQISMRLPTSLHISELSVPDRVPWSSISQALEA